MAIRPSQLVGGSLPLSPPFETRDRARWRAETIRVLSVLTRNARISLMALADNTYIAFVS